MKSFLVAVFLAATFLQPASHAQARVDFSGTWNMDHARSKSPAIGPVTVSVGSNRESVQVR